MLYVICSFCYIEDNLVLCGVFTGGYVAVFQLAGNEGLRGANTYVIKKRQATEGQISNAAKIAEIHQPPHKLSVILLSLATSSHPWAASCS